MDEYVMVNYQVSKNRFILHQDGATVLDFTKEDLMHYPELAFHALHILDTLLQSQLKDRN